MGKSKRAPALFEVIQANQLQGSSSRFPVPKWWRRGKLDTPNYPPPGQREEKPAEENKIIKLVPQFDKPVIQESAPVAPPRSEAVHPAISTTDKPHADSTRAVSAEASTGSSSETPAVGIGGGRLQFSLNPVSLCIAFGVLVLVVAGAYQFGKGYGHVAAKIDDPDVERARAGAADQKVVDVSAPSKNSTPRIERADSGSRSGSRRDTGASAKEAAPPRPTPAPAAPLPSPKKLEPGPEAEPAKAEPLPPAPARVKGLNYLYIVRFRAEHVDDATHARNWLASKGIKTAIDTDGDWLSLVSEEGFDLSKSADKAKRMAIEAKLKELTPAYRQECRAEQRDRYYAFDKPELRKQKD